MAPRPVPVRGRGLSWLAVLLLALAFANHTPAQAPGQEEALAPGESRERPIAAGEAHAWRVEVPANTSLLVVVDQHSIDLVVEASPLAGGEPITVDGGNERWGKEVLLLETAGEHRIEVRPREKSAWPGRYTIRVEALPAPPVAPADIARRDAFALMSRAGREALPDSPEGRRQAVATYRAALAAWRSLGERAWEAETLSCLAILEAESSELRPATEDFLAALALWRELGEPYREADGLNWLGNVYKDTREIGRARETWESARSLWQRLGERYAEEQTRGNLCFLDLLRGAVPAALACYQESLTVFRGVPWQEALILSNIGGAYDNLAEPDQALASYEQALAMRQALGDRRGQAETLNNIAIVHRKLGEWQEALRLYGQVQEISASLGDRALDAKVLNNIGFTYDNLGEPDRARPYYEEALELHRDAGNRSSEIATLNNLGSTWRKLGEPEKALDHHRRALALAETLGDVVQQGTSRLRLAEIHLDRGEGAAALHEIDAVLPRLQQTGNRRSETAALQLRGRALMLAGRAREALPVLLEGATRQRAVRDRGGEAETLFALALAERSLGLATEARAHAEAAVARAEELRIGFASPDLRASFLATRRRAFSLLIDLLMDRHAAEPDKAFDRAAFAVSERARARSLLDALRGTSAVATGNKVPPEVLVRRRSALLRLSDKIDQRWRQSGEKAQTVERDIDAIRAELDGVEAEIRRLDPGAAAFDEPPPVAPDEISGWLEPGTMLLEYSLGEERSFLWTVDAARLRSFVLPSQREIEILARQVYAELSTVESGRANRGDAATALGRILLGPIWSDAARLRRLVVVPDGALHVLPFAALPVPDPGQDWDATGLRKPLLEHLELVSIASATTLALQRQRLQQRPPARKWAAVLADPVFAADDPRLAHFAAAHVPAPSKTRSAESPVRGGAGDLATVLERLPSTRREAEAIQELAPRGLNPADQVWIGLGLAANREAVLSGELRDYRVVHFATHAVADTQNPELSGLVLSLVDREGRSREGFLGLADIYELDLDADLVVLSGCRTALGKEVRGEGLMGLTRGFQSAGVPRVVASLWRVQDRATADLMTLFYRAMWRDHLPAAAALRQAQRALSREPRYRAPYSWAAFVLQGDWR